jgi:raffinose/stachyose/melibiose transport system permease protein
MAATTHSAGTRTTSRSLKAYGLLLPGFIAFGLFFLVPAVLLAWLSSQQWDALSAPSLVGAANYVEAFGDDVLRTAVINNLIWIVLGSAVPITLGFGLAVLLVRGNVRYKWLFRTLLFLPQVLSSVTVAIAWSWIYDPNRGALNAFLEGLGIVESGPAWLGDSALVLPALIVSWSWMEYGLAMVLFIAALQSLDETYFEVAKIEGASKWQTLRYVLLPLLRAPLALVALIVMIDAFQVFDLVFILTHGGPGVASMIVPVYMVLTSFTFHQFGYGAAIGLTWAVLIIIASLILLRSRRAFGS